jgi:hypothetical protein
MIAMLLLALRLANAEPAAPSSPGIYFGETPLCSLEAPEVSTTFRNLPRLPDTPKFTLHSSKAAREFGISAESLLLIERRLGGIILIDVPITVTAVPGREAAYEIVLAKPLQPDDYSFAIKRDAALAFFGCSFSTLP